MYESVSVTLWILNCFSSFSLYFCIPWFGSTKNSFFSLFSFHFENWLNSLGRYLMWTLNTEHIHTNLFELHIECELSSIGKWRDDFVDVTIFFVVFLFSTFEQKVKKNYQFFFEIEKVCAPVLKENKNDFHAPIVVRLSGYEIKFFNQRKNH